MPALRGPALMLAALLIALPARAADPVAVGIAYLALAPKRVSPLVTLDPPPADEGVQGARLALADDQTTGRFLGQTYALHESIQPDAAAVILAAQALLAEGERVIVADLPAALLLQVADLPEAKGAVLLDATSEDDSLRGAGCRAGVLHLLPSRAMLADALMQYLAVKGWRSLLLVQGRADADKAYADALRRSARKFQLRIAADKPWTFQPGAQRTDTGHVSIGAEVARFTQGCPTTCWWWPTRRGSSAMSWPTAPRTPGPSPAPRVAADRLGARLRAVGRDAVAGAVPEAGGPGDDAARLRRLDGRPRRGGGCASRRQQRPGCHRCLPAQPEVRAGGV